MIYCCIVQTWPCKIPRRSVESITEKQFKISPSKCQLFRTELHYMDNAIFYQWQKVCIELLKTILEAIQKLKPPKMTKECRSFAGVVNLLSIFFPSLLKLLKPIYDLTRKSTPFIWTKMHQVAFEETKTHYENFQYYIYYTIEVSFNCIQTLAKWQQVQCCT